MCSDLLTECGANVIINYTQTERPGTGGKVEAMKKRLISALLLLCMLTGMLPLGAFAAKNPFTDVENSDYYYDAVLWAVERGITNGTDTVRFSPDASCTRAQVVTFLWRAMGRPKHSGKCPFTDVADGQYYRDAVVWAAEAGVTTGTSATTFSPDAVVTRAQFVTFLWRALGQPAPTEGSGFTDVAENQYYCRAVLWAAENGVTNGTGAGIFSPEQSCLRGQTVTFLYRALRTAVPEPTEPTVPSEPTEPEPEVPVESAVETATVYRTAELYNGEWRFLFRLKNTSERTVSVTKITIQDLSAGKDVGGLFVLNLDTLRDMFNLTAAPGEIIDWTDGHPLTYRFSGRRYTLELTDTAGNVFVRTYIITFDYTNADNPAADAATPLGQTAPDQTALRQPDNIWKYEIWFRNDTDKTLKLTRIENQNYLGADRAGAPQITDSEQVKNLQTAQYLAPGQVGSFYDSHPYVDFMDNRELAVVYTDEDGAEYSARFRIVLSMAQYHPELETVYPDYSHDNGKDGAALRHDASFSVKVAEGVYWVPANALGTSRYSNAQIQAMLTDTPEQKQAKIGTLYEALQLYQIGGFFGSDDNVHIYQNDCLWEHHKPGYDAVRTNNGCCASSANWLNYILKDDYDEVGFILTMKENVGGHVYNYIKQDGWYYFVDLTIWYADHNANAAESGDLDNYYHSNSIHGNVHCAVSMEAFTQYLIDADDYMPVDLVYTYVAENVRPSTVTGTSGGTQLCLPDNVAVKILYDNPNDTLTLAAVPAPDDLTNWDINEDFAFASMTFQ